MLKSCYKCHKKKDRSSFYKSRARPDGLDEYCKVCRRKVNSAYKRTDKGRETHNRLSRERYRRRRDQIILQNNNGGRERLYGIDQEDYEFLLACQGGVCAICKKPTTRKDTDRLCIDHNHKTGKVRGLLCHRCNTGIGMLQDDPKLLLKAITYLQE